MGRDWGLPGGGGVGVGLGVQGTTSNWACSHRADIFLTLASDCGAVSPAPRSRPLESALHAPISWLVGLLWFHLGCLTSDDKLPMMGSVGAATAQFDRQQRWLSGTQPWLLGYWRLPKELQFSCHRVHHPPCCWLPLSGRVPGPTVPG